MTEEIVGCKWSLSVLGALRDGLLRPAEIERYCTGISTKVLNERLNKLLAFGIVQRIEFDPKRQRVEYHLTQRGQQFLRVLDEIDAIQKGIEQKEDRSTASRHGDS